MGCTSPAVENSAAAKYLLKESSFFRSIAAGGHSGGDGTPEWQSVFNGKGFLLTLPVKLS